MGTKSMKYLLIVACLGLIGCTTEKPTPEKTTTKKSTAAQPTGGATSPQTASGTSGSTATAPQEQQKPDTGSTTSPAIVPQAQTAQPAVEALPEPKTPDVVFVPTPSEVVAKMIELAQVTKNDVVYDLGCGDGRIVVAAAKLGCRAYGFDVDPERIKESKENVQANGVDNLATITQKDIFTLDLSKANVITLYLLPSLNVKLIPQLEKLQPGSRIVSHDFDMKGVTPDQVVQVHSEDGYGHTVYLWTTPLKKETQKPE